MINPKVNKTIEAISYALLYGGIVVVLFTIGTLNESAVSGTLGGYSSATLAVLFLFALSYTNYVSATTDSNTFSIKKIGLMFIPYSILLAILGYSIALISIYFNDISEDKVSPYYSTFSYISIIFIIIQVYLFGKTTNNPEFLQNGTIKTLSLVKLILIGLINIIVLISLGVSLKYFSTDG